MSRPRNIVRIDIPHRNTHGWQVRITRHGTRHTKFFSDKRHDGNEGALEAAVAYRDEQLERLPDPLDGAEQAALARSTTGVPGIRLAVSDGIPRVHADDFTDQVRKVKAFSIKKWGLRKALWKACAWKAQTMRVHDPLTRAQEMYATAYPSLFEQVQEIDANILEESPA